MALPPDDARILDRLERFGVRLGLDATRALLAELGHPEQRFPTVLVAGTNGKGSVSALLAAMATAAGYRTGHYTSPHLEEVEERVRLDGRAITGERLGERLGRVMAAAERASGEPPTYFEALTAAAFLDFAGAGVDLAVVEVGLGGRLDATNATEPVLSVITPIALDHREHLGETIAAVTAEKAGVLRRGRPAVAWPGGEEARASLAGAAAAIGAELVLAPQQVELAAEARGLDGQRVRLRTPHRAYELDLALAGGHQAENLALAVVAAETLAARGFPRLDAAAVTAGAAACRWPGRLEAVAVSPGVTVLLDAAHNPAATARLAAFLTGLGRPWTLLFGTFADKDAAAMLPPLARGAGRLILTRAPGPRGRDPEELRALAGGRPAVVEADLDRALDAALAQGAALVVACGSLHLIGELRRRLRQRYGVPPPATGPLYP